LRAAPYSIPGICLPEISKYLLINLSIPHTGNGNLSCAHERCVCKKGEVVGESGENPSTIDVTSEFGIHKTENRRQKREDIKAWKTGEKK